MNIIGRNTVVYAFDAGSRPVWRVTPPCRIVFETCDCLHGQITDEETTLDNLDFNRVNPASGPVFIEGAEPGDALRIVVKELRLADTGVMVTTPGAGALPDLVKGRTLLSRIDKDYFTFKGLKLPLAPMIGVIGVAPEGAPVSCGVPGAHGGNMDTTGIGVGAVLYLPVFVLGALLAVGDLHAAMGDGEVGVSGVEVAGEAALQVEVKKGMTLPWPLLRTETELCFLSSAETTDEALTLSVRCMNSLLTEKTVLDADEALMLMSACGQARISQVVDPLKTARFCMPLDVLRKFGVDLAF